MASAEHEAITGVWGQSPQRSPGAQPLVGAKGAKPPEAESFSDLRRRKQAEICQVFAFWKLELA